LETGERPTDPVLDGNGVFLGRLVGSVHNGCGRQVNERILRAKNVGVQRKGRAVAARRERGVERGNDEESNRAQRGD
jgi:hypothetical protein